MNNNPQIHGDGHKRKDRHYKIKRRSRPGASPGTLIPDPAATNSVVNMIAYNNEQIDEYNNCSIDTIRKARGEPRILWIDIQGLGNLDLIRQLGEIFGLHLLALEDVVNPHQRPKAEEFDDHIFITTRMILNYEYDAEQVSLFLGKDFVLTFREQTSDCFKPVRKRLISHKGRIREQYTDYLTYALLDTVIDNYFPVLETLGEELEYCEDNIIARPQPGILEKLHILKRNLLGMRRAVWPQREMLNTLIRDNSPFINDLTKIYLRDCYDHVIQLMDIIESYREVASGLTEIYLSSLSNRTNEIMKVLTIIATIFIPLSFIVGLYGMNFDRSFPSNMPELGWRYGYIFALSIMSITVALLIFYLKRKGWIGNNK